MIITRNAMTRARPRHSVCGCTLHELLLGPALTAAERVLPRDRRTVIDGFSARDGLISDCFQGEFFLSPPEQNPRPLT